MKSFVKRMFIDMVDVEGMYIGLVGRKYRITMSVVLFVGVMMKNTGLVLDMKGDRLRHLMMGEILGFRIWVSNNCFLGMDLAVVGFIDMPLLMNLVWMFNRRFETETRVFRKV